MPYKDKERQREANRIYQQQYYQNNKQYYADKAKNRKLRNRLLFAEFKKSLKCEQCGEDHIATLDFHHNDPSSKDILVSKAIATGRSLKSVFDEVEKCTVLCSNCHRKLHYELDNSDASIFI